MKLSPLAILLPLASGLAALQAAPAKVSIGSSSEDTAFETKTTPPPASNDAATGATFKVIAGTPDPNSAPLAALNDGKIPRSDDEPSSNFFFSGGGRILVDLGKAVDVATIASYSWHSGSRSGQFYQVYAADGTAKDFVPEPGAGVDPEKSGWNLIAKVDTTANKPGQHAASISPDSGKSLGNFRYVLFDIQKNPKEPRFNDTFFSEIDITDAAGPELVRVVKPKKITQDFASKDGKYTYTLDATEAPDLQEWAAKNLIPVLDVWYPKIIDIIPVEGMKPSSHITFTLKDITSVSGMGGVPAYASGNSVVFNTKFMRDQAGGEAIGAGIHETVHVVQFAGERAGGEPRGRGKSRPPTWVTEGVADYIRWFLYEPEKHGADITARNVKQSHYDASYRVTANFFDYVIKNYEKDLMRKLNLATHDGYSEDLWKEWTGKTVQELGAEWKKANLDRLGLKE
ncbi:MAG: basic secretory protein-like protein [Luteolibacter sp.]|uniref:basic secretory protein-like protein n=1 Tax=Luteolibacter sp. TaxID=1962973 RepID=UPI003267B711